MGEREQSSPLSFVGAPIWNTSAWYSNWGHCVQPGHSSHSAWRLFSMDHADITLRGQKRPFSAWGRRERRGGRASIWIIWIVSLIISSQSPFFYPPLQSKEFLFLKKKKKRKHGLKKSKTLFFLWQSLWVFWLTCGFVSNLICLTSPQKFQAESV